VTEAKDFFVVSVSRPALEPTQPPDQWVLGVLSPGVKRGQAVILTTHPLSHAKVENEWELYFLSPQVPPWHVVGLLYFIYSQTFPRWECQMCMIQWCTCKCCTARRIWYTNICSISLCLLFSKLQYIILSLVFKVLPLMLC
jgi:hypothetical protein